LGNEVELAAHVCNRRWASQLRHCSSLNSFLEKEMLHLCPIRARHWL